MPTPVNEKLRDLFLTHSVGLDKLSNTVVNDMALLMRDAERQLLQMYNQRLLQVQTGVLRGAETTRIYRQAIQETGQILNQHAPHLYSSLEKELTQLAQYEADFVEKTLREALPAGVAPFANIHSVNPDVLHALVTDAPFHGAVLGEYFAAKGPKSFPVSVQRAMQKTIKRNLALGMHPEESVRALKKTGLETSRRNLRAIARSASQHTLNSAAEKVFEANARNPKDSVLKGLMWLSTLDMRTTLEFCVPRDHALYDVMTKKGLNDRAKRYPWRAGPGRIHWGCRSKSSPVTKSWKELGIKAKEVQRRDRASMDGLVPRETTAEEWLKRQLKSDVKDQTIRVKVPKKDGTGTYTRLKKVSRREKLEKLYGKKKMQAWADGKIGIEDMVKPDGKMLTLEELGLLEGVEAKLAGPDLFLSKLTKKLDPDFGSTDYLTKEIFQPESKYWLEKGPKIVRGAKPDSTKWSTIELDISKTPLIPTEERVSTYLLGKAIKGAPPSQPFPSVVAVREISGKTRYLIGSHESHVRLAKALATGETKLKVRAMLYDEATGAYSKISSAAAKKVPAAAKTPPTGPELFLKKLKVVSDADTGAPSYLADDVFGTTSKFGLKERAKIIGPAGAKENAAKWSTQTLDLKQTPLTATQKQIPAGGMKKYIKTPPKDLAEIVVYRDAEGTVHYLVESHTRVGAAIARGDKTIQVRTILYDEVTGTYQKAPPLPGSAPKKVVAAAQKKVAAAGRPAGLSSIEGQAVEDWMMHSEFIQESARRGLTGAAKVEALDAAIARAGTVGDYVGTTYRGVLLEGSNPAHQRILANLKKGGTVSDEGFMAVSRNRAVAERFAQGAKPVAAGDVQIIYELEIQGGVRGGTVASSLDEILLERGVSIKVTNVRKTTLSNGSQRWVVQGEASSAASRRALAKTAVKTKSPKPGSYKVPVQEGKAWEEIQSLGRELTEFEGADLIGDAPWSQAGKAVRAKLKKEIVADLAKRMETAKPDVFRGLTEAQKERLVSRLIGKWADTSGDSDAMAIAMQMTAKKRFGLKDAKLDHFSSHVRARAQSLLRDKVSLTADRAGYGRPFRTQSTLEEIAEVFMDAQYQATQEYFKKAGIKHVTVVRGATYGRAGRVGLGTMELQPMSSFTVDVRTALQFSGGDTLHLVRVPVENVLGTFRTGYGCAAEYEVVLLGGRYTQAWSLNLQYSLLEATARQLAKIFGGEMGRFERVFDMLGEWGG